ncbi:hypothetical protein JRQ81_000814 [Phrynocephalus forsythii]|uniref:TRAF3-interacting protein 1 n=1 Tax=Phrynocephalus forsythii TaxID=171643 RepID=A0A9Q1B8E3_9SAUR|nr:hypothetical protein JRQ81_000814 [Phrynocephalus forsythii]
MFGNLFDEDLFMLPNNRCKKPKCKLKDAEPPLPRESTNLSGLKNQGGTCYLNSLLQTLLFTPEFREALFSIGPEELGSLDNNNKPESKVRIIPLQLQRLFAQLLLLDQHAATTTELTESFGWNSNEEMRQHDVQELNRILFSALETSLVGTSGHNLINELYHGTVVNQIVCKECKNVSEKQEDFLDLTVAVKGVSGLEEALWNMYVEEEHFEKENLYRCGECNKLVEATKSAKLRKLPPFLTISLLRFNFDFEKCERYKETSCYTFPVRINLKPFCEQAQLDDVEYMYELFSVIIHKGGCYGGHYHAYIRDTDELGNWQVREEDSLNDEDKDLKYTENMKDSENPFVILKSILMEEESKEIAVDRLAQKLLERKNVSWNKKYRKEYGPIRKYLQSHPQTFLLISNGNKVRLNDQSHKLYSGSPSQSHLLRDDMNLPFGKASASLKEHVSEPHWFDLNDAKVQAIREREIEKQFQGNESAYMLFYRKSQMTRPPEAQGNPSYRVPVHLLNEMDAANIKLQKKRADYELADNNVDLHLHIHSHYKFCNGALHPLLSQKESVVDLAFDKRKTLGELRQAVLQLLEFGEGDLVLSLAKTLPAGLHIYQTLEGDDSPLSDAGLFDGSDIFVWNGKEVNGVEVRTGVDHEPLLINVLRLAGHNEGRQGQQFVESQHVFPCGLTLRMVCELLTSSQGIILRSPSGSEREPENWEVVPEEDMGKSLKMVGLVDGSSLFVLDSHDQSMMNVSGGSLTAFTHDISWLQVKNFCGSDSEEMQVKITATVDTVMADIRLKAIEEMQLDEELVNNTCLRPISKYGKLLGPVPEDYTVKEAELKMGSLLGLCPGTAPTTTQVFLYYIVGHDLQSGSEEEIVVEETTTVRECLKLMLKKSGLAGDSWHLRKVDWYYEAGEALNEEDATLKELNISNGEMLNVAEGKVTPKGFLKVPVWWYKPFSHLKHRRSVQDHVTCLNKTTGAWGLSTLEDLPTFLESEVDLCYVGDIEISEEALLEDLKIQVMTLPPLQEFSVPLPAFLRVWSMENKHPSKLLRNNKEQLQKLKLGNRLEICVEPLHKEENLGLKDILLRVLMGIPGERDYYHPVDLVWDISKECVASALRQRIASYYSLPVENIEIAKYSPGKFEWMPICSWTQQVSKKKKKKKSDNLQLSPYCLKDGDIIGVKNLLVDDSKDFSTVKDDIGKQMQKHLAVEKQSCQQNDCLQKDPFRGKQVAKHRKPETALSIRVCKSAHSQPKNQYKIQKGKRLYIVVYIRKQYHKIRQGYESLYEILHGSIADDRLEGKRRRSRQTISWETECQKKDQLERAAPQQTRAVAARDVIGARLQRPIGRRQRPASACCPGDEAARVATRRRGRGAAWRAGGEWEFRQGRVRVRRSAAMQGSVVRRTQELLGRVIRKPPLTERLLSKPPFRYLHDVIGEVVRSTGFMRGLYTEEEMKSDNVKDKDAKISFLQKAIDVVILVTGEPLAVKPARIVAGHEPERTNELLQAIAKCCLNKLSSDEAVKKVLVGEKSDIKGKTGKHQNRDSRAEEHRLHKEGRGDSEIKEKTTSHDQMSKEELKEEESKRKEKESDKHKDHANRQKNLDKDREGEKPEKERTKNRSSKQGRETEKIRDKEKGAVEGEKDERDKERDRERKQHEGGREKDRSREKDKERGRDKEKEHEKAKERGKDKEKEKRRERAKDMELPREQRKDKKAPETDENVTKRSVEQSAKDNAGPDKESENTARLSKQHSAKGPRQRAKAGGEGRREASKSISSTAVEGTGNVLKEKVEQVITAQEPGVMGANSMAARLADEKPTTILQGKAVAELSVKQRGESSSDAEGDMLNTAANEKIIVPENTEIANEPSPQVTQRRLPRPNSARPAPPRIKRQESTDVLVPERNGSAKIVSNVIIDKEEEEEDDQFVVEAAPQLPDMTENAMEATVVDLEGDEKHGGLVKRILETKKDFELSQLPKSAEKERPLLSEAAKRKEKDLVAKEIDKFRGSIQALCRSALPLGKIMDYIQEDVDAMKNELQMWQNENKQLEEALQKEQGITDGVVEPLKAELAELDQLIKDEQDRICAKRANILKNEEKFRR